MATNLKQFDSVGGFSVDKTTLTDENLNVKNVNTLELKNSEFTDSHRTNYILRGLNTAILALDGTGSQLILPNETINFVTAHIIGTKTNGGAHYSLKIESTVTCDSVGTVQLLSSLTTIIKDSISSGETWTVIPFDGGATNRFSYSVTRAGTTDTIKWIAAVDVISILWS
jgi:hypothetical protein